MATFGSGAARVGASLTTAAGAKIALRRRYGRVRTLVDEGGNPCGDEVLSSLTGSTDRTRFTRLFGLDHEDLRTGGDELLRADGDVGRLIVEAGGGLRALMGKLVAIDREIDDLFALRRKESRAFYRALDAYDAADRAWKATVLTSEAHDRDVRAHADAVREVAEAKGARREVTQSSSRMGRVARVLPMLRRLDHAEAVLLGYADVEALPADFAARCESLLTDAEDAAVRLEEARSRHADLALRLSGMVVDERLRDAEAEILDVAERAAVVRAGREDRSKRLEDLAAAEAQLDQLRELLGLERGGRTRARDSVGGSPARRPRAGRSEVQPRSPGRRCPPDRRATREGRGRRREAHRRTGRARVGQAVRHRLRDVRDAPLRVGGRRRPRGRGREGRTVGAGAGERARVR